ncbi:MAG: LemA family protein [Phycisphaeraceae bacterium]|nr:LemA family protein [Phycisphaeraceae bacterium]MCW5755004.1 LemA family protein [Phycisphaeraceae bacterium]
MTEVLIVIGAAAFLALLWLIITYNRFISLRQHIRESWADIDVELKRRHDLIPNLVETVKGYAAHERTVLEEVTTLRRQVLTHQGCDDTLGADESALMLAVGRLFAIAEAYPDLKADTGFRQLQQQLADTEDRIAASRRFFNANVRDYRRLRESFPTNIVANLFKFAQEAFFELTDQAERVVPRINLGTA